MPNKKSTNRATKNVSSSKVKTANKKRNIIIAVLSVAVFSVIGYMLLRPSQAAVTNYTSFLDSGCTGTPTLGLGNQGPCVRAVQVGMNNWTRSQNSSKGKSTPPQSAYLVVDGIYGQSTKNKVADYQRGKNLTGKNISVDGVVGSATWAAMLNDCNVFNTCYVSTGSK